MKVNTVNKSKFRGLFGFSKYTVTLILIYFLLATGVTYAYFAFQYQNDSVIVGNIISLDADLEVELIVGANNEFVPMSNEALSNAINGVGSENGACVDQKGNLSCQVYKITFTNNGSRLKHITGTIELYAKDGTGNVYNNLKWRELTNATTVKESAIVNGMDKSILVSDLTVESKEVKEWYIAVWLSETNSDQLGTDKGDFGGTVTFESGSGGSSTTNIFTETILKPSAQPDTNIDFSKTSEATSTNGVYLMSSTANDTNPIYYYRGNVNNNLIFANTCWKVVRTTNTGGLKLLYNGTPSNGQCNNTGSSSQLGTKAFNSSSDSPAYVGYMYSSPYAYSNEIMSDITDTYYYGNDVIYSNGTYTLTDTISSNSWSSIYNGGLNNNHYTCLSTGTTCSSVYYIYYTDSRTAYYIELTNGEKVEHALGYMLGRDDANTENYNTISSTIKGNKDTEGTLDYWYYTNIEQKGYSSYIEDTVWCNDRSISELNGWNPDGGNTRDYLYFSSNNRVNSNPSLTCTRNIDSFTVSEANGNGDLDYPVGLLTSEEIILAGANDQYTTNYSYYLYNGNMYWGGSPIRFDDTLGIESIVDFDGILGGSLVYYSTVGVRPSISLKPGFSLTGNGDGTATNPYIVS